MATASAMDRTSASYDTFTLSSDTTVGSVSLDKNGTAAKCSDKTLIHIYGLLAIPTIAVIINTVMIVAVLLHRSRLRQKHVYIFVTSSLIANVVFEFFAMYQLINHQADFEQNPAKPTASAALKNWWSFRKALLACLLLVMVANIGILIHAIHEGTQLIAVASIKKQSKTKPKSFYYQRRKALLLVALSWGIPIVLALATVGGWNCTTTCECLTRCYNQTQLNAIHNRPCSRIWIPMTNSFMAVVVILLTLELLVLCFLIFKTLTQSLRNLLGRIERRSSWNQAPHSSTMMRNQNQERRTSYPDLETARSSTRGEENFGMVKFTSASSDAGLSRSDNYNATTTSSQMAESGELGVEGTNSTRNIQTRMLRSHFSWSRSATKEILLITILFVLCVTPTVIAILIDMFQQEVLSIPASSALLSISSLYCILSPFLFMRHFGGLKEAVDTMWLKATTRRRTSRPGGGKRNQISEDGQHSGVVNSKHEIR